MEIAVTGAHGYIGEKLIIHLLNKGYKIKPVKRQLLYGDTTKLSEYLSGTKAVINLAGAPILQRWTDKNKQVIYASRILTTQKIAEAINSMPDPLKPEVFISASAVGIYESGITHNEESLLFDNGFVGKTVIDWEQASESLDKSVRRVIFRSGIVLGKESQTIKKLVPIFKSGLGGQIGNGKQPFPFIHIEDLINVFIEGLKNENYDGIYNLVAPENVSNKEFTRVLSKLLKIPAPFVVPAFALKLLYGKAAYMLLESPVVIPEKLIEKQFSFKYPTLKKTLVEILS